VTCCRRSAADRRVAARCAHRDRHRSYRRATLAGATEAALADAGIVTSRIVVGEGEASKSYAVLQDVCEGLIAAKIERNDLVVALGAAWSRPRWICGFDRPTRPRFRAGADIAAAQWILPSAARPGSIRTGQESGRRVHQPVLVVATPPRSTPCRTAVSCRLCGSRQIRPARDAASLPGWKPTTPKSSPAAAP